MWPRCHSLSSRVSTRMNFSPASRRFLISRKSISLMRFFDSLTIFRNSGECACAMLNLLFATSENYRTSERLHIAPVRAGFDVHQERDTQRMNLLHAVLYERRQLRQLAFGPFEKQFIMNLQDHARAKILFGKTLVNFDHGQLDQIGRGALQRRVHRCALRKIAKIHLRRIDFWDGPDAPEESARETSRAGFSNLPLEVFFYSAVALEVCGNEFRRFLLFNLQILREAERRKPVDDSEVNHFCGAAMLGSLRKRSGAENFLRCAGMNVLALAERLDKNRILREMRENAQLDLRIVR